MASKVLHMMHIKWPKTSRNIAMIKFGVVLKIVVECLTRDRGAAGSSLTGVTALLSFYPSLVLVQPRKTRPCLTERLLMGRKESNQIKHPGL